jgi:dinuclear metal center YbgI/SA1388 family protein
MSEKIVSASGTINRWALVEYLQDYLQLERFNDYCPNGLQVEGADTVRRIASGVTASIAFIEAALAAGADTLLVHHGYFWRGESPCVTGQKHRRLKALLTADLNLLAYHLPLDAHPEVGNNAQLALRLGLVTERTTGDKGLVHVGRSTNACTVGELRAIVHEVLGRKAILIGSDDMILNTVSWCTGAAQGAIEDACAAGATVYLSGEISEPTAHFAREMGIVYLACGHHATERYGVQALGAHLAERFNVQHQFIDIPNPA